MTKKAAVEQERSEYLTKMRDLIKPGDTVYSVLRHVSRSGMSRVISFYVYRENKPVNIDYAISVIEGYSRSRTHDGLSVGGAGMDMGFSVAYNLSSALYGGIGYECFKVKAKDENAHCPSNHHTNGGESFSEPVHRDGYAIEHRWQ